MVIKVLGSGCKNCQTLEKNVHEALEHLGKEAEVLKVTDMIEIQKYGVMRTPGLVVDEKVVVSGRVPKAKEIQKILS
ncbi:TM0996/MTH895 family glutaredoxin-like protein [Enterococcus raffinosus]|uniref:thioredoxin family protein n=1 Tax=Enterococcus raffinosus TaxID=71452 RepID=UPI000E24748F|nr:thioredoxin family protein [Enterococcus raffinosus]MBU5362036.1 TM0996/MTH895 family glutaredoxin-like protein [Enterococcus raffinosus]REC32569.1 thioredoxin family protein [Enterococcus pseudoavium]